MIAAAMLGKAGGLTAVHRCAASETRAVVAGRVACLSVGKACQSRYAKAYRRYGFICHNQSLRYDWRRLHRPLHVPTIGAGTTCPATRPRPRAPPSVNLPYAFGPGPAYPTLDLSSGRAAAVMVWPPTEQPYFGWAGTKILWRVPMYAGAVLVRGRQLDGTSQVGFDRGPDWTHHVLREIKLVGPGSDSIPAATFVRTPGCYAYQIDTLRRSYLIVFDVTFRFAS